MASLYYEKKISQSLFWGSVNCFMLFVIIYDLSFNKAHIGALRYIIEFTFSIISSLSIVFHIVRLIYLLYNDEYKKLGSVNRRRVASNEEGPGIKKTLRNTSTPLNRFKSNPIISTMNLSYYLKQYERAEREKLLAERSRANLSSGRDRSSSDWFNSQSEFYNLPLQDDGNSSLSLVTDTKYEQANHFWNSSDASSKVDSIPVFRRTQYQLSLSASDSGHSFNDDGGSPLFQRNYELWLKYKINPDYIVTWIGNLRMWISSTILQRIVEEIAVINTGLRKQGLAGLAVGSVGLETLTNTAHNIIVAHNIPSLPFLIPFLQLSSNQQYIVQRIKELAIGSSMSEYRWKSGGKFNDKEWDSHLPTDAELVMHLVCTYLDSQLPLLPTQPDARPFTTKYLVKVKEQPIQKELAIRQHSVHPPHYNLIINGEIQDIPQGRNNLFYTLLMFICVIQANWSGMLERINLGQSGINMLWIVSKPETE